ncbi:MAG: class I SAM-dependent methyltransferase [Candidatus Niyogibacteria bacterium]|nr:class I SAM-dependent methyltransferase [Candidatus Niyogibacteria bacterium]
MLIRFLQKNKFFRAIIYKLGRARAKPLISRMKPFLNKEERMLDIGPGTCNIYELLLEEGYDNITPLDIQDVSFVDGIKPILYDGHKIPFHDNAFDLALIITVLHHTPSPEKIIEEATRVSKKIIIIEDIYTNMLHKYVTYFFDSLINLEFFGHPHTNKNDRQWREVFHTFGLKIVESRYDRSLIVFKHATYYLEK